MIYNDKKLGDKPVKIIKIHEELTLSHNSAHQRQKAETRRSFQNPLKDGDVSIKITITERSLLSQ